MSSNTPSGSTQSQTPQRAASLPDMNTETYPYEVVLHLLDEAAFFPFFSIPNRSNAVISQAGSSSAIGMQISEKLHRFRMTLAPSGGRGLCAHNLVGEPLATFEHRWLFAPDGFGALPGHEPPPVRFDPTRSQRFVMLDSICKFDNGKDGFRGFGTGRTYPTTVNGRHQLLAGAVGIILEGFGKFQGLEGIYTYCGSISPDRGFTGNLFCRVMDFQGVLRTQRGLPDLQATGSVEPNVTYLLFRGQKKDKHERTSYIFGPNGTVDGFELHPQIRIVNIDCALDARGSLYSTSNIGPVIGNFSSYVFFNVLNPGAPGTPTAPINFTDYDDNIFTDREGREIGGFAFDGGAGARFGYTAATPGEGRTFTLQLPSAPGQQALRFGGYAPIVNDRGIFKGLQGLVSDNSAVGVAPHAIATTYIARISDPEHRFRSDTSEVRRKTYICEESKETGSYKCESAGQ